MCELCLYPPALLSAIAENQPAVVVLSILKNYAANVQVHVRFFIFFSVMFSYIVLLAVVRTQPTFFLSNNERLFVFFRFFFDTLFISSFEPVTMMALHRRGVLIFCYGWHKSQTKILAIFVLLQKAVLKKVNRLTKQKERSTSLKYQVHRTSTYEYLILRTRCVQLRVLGNFSGT